MTTYEKIQILNNYIWKMRSTLIDEDMLSDEKNVTFNKLYDKVEVLRLSDIHYANVIDDIYCYCMNNF